jgi:DNA topoisomerase-1
MDSEFSRIDIFKHFVKEYFKDDDKNKMNRLKRDTQTKNKTIKITNATKKINRLSRDSKYKWSTLEHNGILFPPEYEMKNIPLIYNEKEIYLSKEAEEAAFLYAKYIGTEYTSNSTFNKNFFHDFKKILGKNTEIQNLALCDFSKMKQYLLDSKEKTDKIKKDNKEKDKNNKEKENKDDKYKIAIVDGKEQGVSNFRMEPPGIFIGRGKNPHLGKIKRRIYPEDIIINIGKESKIPIATPNHKWKKVIHDRKVEWLVSWKDTITGKTKYLWLSAHSEMKSGNDQKKFDLAKKLKKKIKTINETNDKNLRSNDIKTRQIATALFFIDKLALRVGNEKSEDETDTVGTSSLRVEHIDLSENNKITLNFLGKDSVPYTNTVNVDEIIYKNVQEFIKDKDEDEQIFDQITSNDINKYLQEFMKDLTAKVYRTYNASNLLQKELKKINKKYEGHTKGEYTKEILDDFIKANAKVAKMMNHQKNVSVGYTKTVQKIVERINDLKKDLKKEMNSLKKNDNKIKKIKDKIKNYKSKMEIVKEMKNISLGTSKANYIDPRILVAFIKTHDIPVDKIFTKTLQEKFKWAFEVDESYKF